MPLEEMTILLSDLDEVRQVLAACLTYFQARDLSAAQIEFRAARPSPITAEVGRIKDRFDAYLGDYLLRQHEADLEEDGVVGDEVEEGAEDGSEGVAEGVVELSTTPLGDFKKPNQKGRRLKAAEVSGSS